MLSHRCFQTHLCFSSCAKISAPKILLLLVEVILLLELFIDSKHLKKIFISPKYKMIRAYTHMCQ